MNQIANLSSIDLNLLVSLNELSRSESVTEAARRMGVTQSAMSHQLKRLRELFADPLFLTSLRPMQPTPRAAELVEPVRELLTRALALTKPVPPFDPSSTDRAFVVAATDLAEFTIAARARRHFAQAAPNARMSFVRRTNVSEDLREGRVDLAVLPSGVPGVNELSGPVRRRRVSRDGFCVLMQQDHPAAAQPLTLARYLKLHHLLVSPSGAPGGLVDVVLGKMGKSRRVSLQLSHFVSAPFVVAQTDLVLTCPIQIADEASHHVQLARFKPPLKLPTIDAFAFWHERFHEEPGNRWFRQTVFELNDESVA